MILKSNDQIILFLHPSFIQNKKSETTQMSNTNGYVNYCTSMNRIVCKQ